MALILIFSEVYCLIICLPSSSRLCGSEHCTIWSTHPAPSTARDSNTCASPVCRLYQNSSLPMPQSHRCLRRYCSCLKTNRLYSGSRRIWLPSRSPKPFDSWVFRFFIALHRDCIEPKKGRVAPYSSALKVSWFDLRLSWTFRGKGRALGHRQAIVFR